MSSRRFAAVVVIAWASGCASSYPTCPTPERLCGGACQNLTSSHDNCGECGYACGAAQVCVGGACVTGCPGGQTACSGSCVTLASDVGNCGMCGTSCPSGQVCSSSHCTTTCGAGQVACNRSCIDPTSDAGHCGATSGCGTPGGSAGMICPAGQSCVAGACIGACPGTEISCGASCIDPATDRRYCGASGSCSDAASQGVACGPGEVCSGGVCAVSCPMGELVCGARCIDPLTDPGFCGATDGCGAAGAGSAGMQCTAGQACVSGACAISCPPPQLDCGGQCVDPSSDNQHCGASASCDSAAGTAGMSCASGTNCIRGACTTSCPGTQINCAGVCVDPKTDNSHCGAMGDCSANNAGIACAPGSLCSGGSCGATCASSLSNCGGTCVDEGNDPNHCGSCAACTNGTQVATSDCRSSTCVVATCNAGFADCNHDPGDGCEIALAADDNNCGGCNNVCQGEVCVSGVCLPPIFDSLTGPVSQSTRGAGNSCGTAISVVTARTITHIAVKNNLTSAGNIRFLVFAHGANTALLVTAAQPVAANGDSWKVSAPLSFALAAATSYDIGAISDVGGTWDFDTYLETASGMSSLTENPNWTTFATPTWTGTGGGDCGIRLF